VTETAAAADDADDSIVLVHSGVLYVCMFLRHLIVVRLTHFKKEL